MIEQTMILERLQKLEIEILRRLHTFSTHPRRQSGIFMEIFRILREEAGIPCGAIGFFWEDESLKRLMGTSMVIIGVPKERIWRAYLQLIERFGQTIRLIDIFLQSKAIPLWLKPPPEKKEQDKFEFVCRKFNSNSNVFVNSEIFKRIIFDAYNVDSDGDVFYYPSYLGNRVFFDAVFAFTRSLNGWERLYVERVLHVIVTNVHIALRIFAFRDVSLRSAIAAIMSRNMSHNIGSHVLARIVTGGIGGWTEKLGVEDIVKKLTVDCLIKQLDEALQSKQVNTDPCQALKERLNSYRNFPDPVRDRPYVTSEQARSLVTWGKDVQFLARYLQQRMDFIAQISTEWPTWSEPTWFMRDMMRWFLSQKHLLDNIARSDGLKAHLYEQSSTGATSTACSPSSSAASPAPGSPTQGDADGTQANQTQNAASAYQQEQEPGDIRLHVFLAPKDCWNKTCKSSGDRVRARRDQIKSGCTKDAAQLPCKCDRDGSGQPCEHCHRILLYTSKDSVECCLGKDFQVAVPGGIVGQHAFFTILENIIRNAAKHGYARQKGQLDHLDVVIEVLYDPEERVAVQNLEDDQPKRIPAHLLRIYTNVSPVEGEGAVVSLDKINGILGKGIIKETGEMEKANWGHAEMKIAVGYLQRREIMHIGGQGQEITGESSKTMLELGESENGSRAIIRAVESPIGTLGYEFYIPRPRTVGIVCPEGGAS